MRVTGNRIIEMSANATAANQARVASRRGMTSRVGVGGSAMGEPNRLGHHKVKSRGGQSSAGHRADPDRRVEKVRISKSETVAHE